MAILATSTTLFGQNVPKVCLEGDQSQGYVFDPTTGCFVEESLLTTQVPSDPEIIEGFNCYTTVANGTTTGFIVPWRAINEQSLIVTVNGIKLTDTQYSIIQNTQSTLVTLVSPPTNGDSVEIVGIQVDDETQIKRLVVQGNGSLTEYVLNWVAVSEQSLIVSVDGVIQQNADFNIRYTATNATILEFALAPAPGAVVEIVGLLGFGASSFRLYEDTGDGVTSDYQIPWWSDTCGSLLITIDGVKQDTTDFTVTPIDTVSTTVSFLSTPTVGQSIEIVGYLGLRSVASPPEPYSVVGNNLGGIGESIYSSSTRVGGKTTLDFKKLIAGTGMSFTSDANAITLNSSGVGSSFANIGLGSNVLVTPAGSAVEFRSLVAGSGITLTQNTNDIEISTDGSAVFLAGAPSTDYARQILVAADATGESIIKKGSAVGNSTFELFSIREGNGITVTRVNDDLVIADANGGNYVSVATNYNVERDDSIVGVSDTSVPRVITLANTSTTGPGKTITIKDESGNASVNNITVNGFNGSQTIDGSLSVTISTNYGSVTLYSDNVSWYSI